MTSISPTTDSRSRLRGALHCLALLAFAAVLRFALRSQLSTDLGPRPDALEYASAAESLAHGHEPAFTLDGHLYPSRYPYGVALLLAPFALILRDPARLWWAIAALGVASVGLTWLLARRIGGLAAAGFAAFVVAVSPRHATESALVMSEIPSTVALLALALLFLWWQRSGRSIGHLLWIGGLAGAAASIRWPNLLVVVPMAVAILSDSNLGRNVGRSAGRWQRASTLLVLLIGCTLTLAPEWLYRLHCFGAIDRTGYHFWQPQKYASWRTCYNPAFLWDSPAPDRSGYGNLHFYGRALSGWRAALWSPVTMVLIAAGLCLAWRRRRDPVAPWITLLPLATVAFYLPYAFHDQRMSVPTVPLFAITGGLALESLLNRFRSAPARAVCFVLALAGALFGVGMGDRNRRGLAETSVAGELADALDMAETGRPVGLHESLARAAGEVASNGVVVADLPRLQLDLYLPPGVDVVNLSIDTGDRAGEGPDEEVRLILRHGLKPLDGGPPPRVLLRNGVLDCDVLGWLKAAAAAGRPIEVWLTPRSPSAEYARLLTGVLELDPTTASCAGSEPLRRFRVVPKRG